MISKLEAFHYRCFDRLDINLGLYHVLAGANGSGKSTMLDIPLLLGDILSHGLSPAFLESDSPIGGTRAQTFQELLYRNQGEFFGFVIEAVLPESIILQLIDRLSPKVKSDNRKWPNKVRYEIRFQVFNKVDLQVSDEFLYLVPAHNREPSTGWEIGGSRPRTWRTIISRESGNPSTVKAEYNRAKFELRLEPQQVAFANLPSDATLFPASIWFRVLLKEGMMRYEPNWSALRKASPPGQRRVIRSDAANLPWLILNLKRDQPDTFNLWVEHVRTALPNIVSIDAIEREEDYHAYLKLDYDGGYCVTSSGLSDGTLRILALTILPYLSGIPNVICLEEPENGIHPRAVEVVLQSLNSLYNSQVWVSTHSPVVLAFTNLSSVILMRRKEDGSIEAITGTQHPHLKDWQAGMDLGSLFAAGILE